MTVLITLTLAGTDTGPFNLYSNLDGYVTPFETAVAKAALEAGYSSALVPDGATVIRVSSQGDCPNSIDIILTTPPCISFSYTTVDYFCIDCSIIGGGTIHNDAPLTIGLYYHNDVTRQISLIQTYIGCNATSPTSFIIDAEGSALCSTFLCPP